MSSHIVAVYCVCDDMFIAFDHRDDAQRHCVRAAAMGESIVATTCF